MLCIYHPIYTGVIATEQSIPKQRFFYSKVETMQQTSNKYLEYMQSNAWDKKRRRRLKKDRNTCQGCGATNKPLDVHHLTYVRFGNERISDLQSLCRRCHDEIHGKETRIAFRFCQTCGNLLLTFIKRIKIFGTWWTDYTCQDGHMRSYKDD